jgi:hypothetical protein
MVSYILRFGFSPCFHSFLHTFIFLPICIALAVYRAFANTFTGADLPAPQRAGTLRISISTFTLALLTDVSIIYLSTCIRGQGTIKRYVVYIALEVSTISVQSRCVIKG